MLSEKMVECLLQHGKKCFWRDGRTVSALYNRGLICSVHWDKDRKRWKFTVTNRGLNIRKALFHLSLKDRKLVFSRKITKVHK